MEETLWDKIPLYPSLKNVQKQDFWKPNETQYKLLQDVSRAHIESFNFITRLGLYKAIENIPPVEYELPNGDRVKLEIKDASIGYPNICGANNLHAVSLQLYPSECRASGITYKSKLEVSLQWSKNGIVQDVVTKNIGEIPIMVKSNVCNLSKLTPKQLIEKGEEEEEFGGYFIINGIEKIMRLLLVQRRNYPLSLARSSWKSRGKMFSEYGVSIRCVREDQTATEMVLHYLTNGTAQLKFSYGRELFFVPIVLMLKALCDVSDYYIYTEMTKSKEDDTFFKGCVANMLRQVICIDEGLFMHIQIKRYLGKMFRVKLGLPDWYSDEEVASFLLKSCIATHLEHNVDKFNLLIFMTRKLFATAKGECAVESADSAMNQEALLPGHIYLAVLKEKIALWLQIIKKNIEKKAKAKGAAFDINITIMNNCVSTSMDLSRPMEYLLATGNVNARSLLGLPQITGLSVVAEKLNYWRYLSHFRSIHRGAIFTEMRTTTVRKLLPESWGFLCPVNTPDGAPCGLLNHLTAFCEIVNVQPPVGHLPKLLTCLGMIPYDGIIPTTAKFYYIVFLDGKVIGWVSAEKASDLVNKLRYLKTLQKEKVSNVLEIGFVPKTAKLSQYPGIFLFSTPSRFVRPVHNLSVNSTEMVGTFEQVYLDICVIPDEAIAGITTHQEIREISILSILANMIPFSDFNQSPRNMYQCQMGKQTMGTPCYAYKYRSDNKLYRIQTPHTPLVRPTMYDYYHMDNYPTGTNAIVAVISYTGYDMEDAIVLNKSSLERGFKYGGIYKSVFVDLRDLAGDRSNQTLYMFGKKYFGTELERKLDIELKTKIDEDGLPFIGTRLDYESPMCSYIDLSSNEVRVIKYKSTESAYVFDVKIIGSENGVDILQKICITLWIPRPPIIGDKFASRHGQKGVCSQKWPIENMPFTESGMVPDIIFNPHGFPSRMTIGMMIESMAGKSASLHGIVHDATAFKFSESYPASEYFGELLQKAGYNYFGTERMYSGIDGRELEADIFFGVVYYQRLRHMVADKFQVRTTGPIDILTHQPVKGRKRAGGIRFGEMERDSLLAHGTSFLLHDRLFNCSDKSMAYVCRQCGSLLSPLFEKPVIDENLPFSKEKVPSWKCITCNTDDTVDIISIPYVFRYLVTELAAINIKVKLDIR
ncbi:DNA-directed RNA polymerase I subunit RPA2 [Centruroides vittatus]|uniref:DNA-directed RNA polymerase I subunit RPA2 n=1 Tax=Centruroides vittatus TaxID=120091 RepID=UPI00350FA316